MAGCDDDGVGAAAERLSVRGRLWRAAMLARMGDGARTIADRLADACRFGDARSCFDAGAPLQLTVDAPLMSTDRNDAPPDARHAWTLARDAMCPL